MIINSIGDFKDKYYQGIQVVNSAKFRGLESPVVIVKAMSGSSDESLFCAYTRATSRCIVIYEAASMISGRYKTFGQAILDLDQSGEILKVANRGLTSTIFRESNFNLYSVISKNIEIYWHYDWLAWVVIPTEDNYVSRIMWVYHLITTTDYPVYTWGMENRGDLVFFKTTKDISSSVSRSCRLEYCQACSILSPHMSQVCMTCNIFKNVNLPVECKIQMRHEDTLELRKSSQYKELSIFLIGLGRWRHKVSDKELKRELSSYAISMSSCMGVGVSRLLTLIDVIEADIDDENSCIKLDDLSDKYREKWCQSLTEIIDKESWRKMVAHGINFWIKKGLLKKKRKGVYKKAVRTEDFLRILSEKDISSLET